MATDVTHEYEELDGLETEASVSNAQALESLPTGELVLRMNDRDTRAADAVRKAAEEIAAAVDGVTARMQNGGRLIYVGAGTSGRLGVLDASEIPPTFGIDPGRVVGVIAGGPDALTTSVEAAEDDPTAGIADMASLSINAKDAVVGIASSGRTPYVLGAVRAARDAHAFTVGISCNAGTPLSAAVDCGIEVPVGPEFIAGSTRLVAGTATKMVLNMISTITMVRLGRTYGPYMIDVHATNEKLRRRAVRIVATISGASDARSRNALEATGWSPRAAAVMIRRNTTAAVAEQLLDHAHGSLRDALEVE